MRKLDLVVLDRLSAQVSQGVVVHRRVHRLHRAALAAVILRTIGGAAVIHHAPRTRTASPCRGTRPAQLFPCAGRSRETRRVCSGASASPSRAPACALSSRLPSPISNKFRPKRVWAACLDLEHQRRLARVWSRELDARASFYWRCFRLHGSAQVRPTGSAHRSSAHRSVDMEIIMPVGREQHALGRVARELAAAASSLFRARGWTARVCQRCGLCARSQAIKKGCRTGRDPRSGSRSFCFSRNLSCSSFQELSSDILLGKIRALGCSVRRAPPLSSKLGVEARNLRAEGEGGGPSSDSSRSQPSLEPRCADSVSPAFCCSSPSLAHRPRSSSRSCHPWAHHMLRAAFRVPRTSIHVECAAPLAYLSPRTGGTHGPSRRGLRAANSAMWRWGCPRMCYHDCVPPVKISASGQRRRTK